MSATARVRHRLGPTCPYTDLRLSIALPEGCVESVAPLRRPWSWPRGVPTYALRHGTWERDARCPCRARSGARQRFASRLAARPTGHGAHGNSIRQRRAVDELHDERAVLDAVDLRDCGWFSAARISASRWKRASRAASVATASGSILIATDRFRFVSVARVDLASRACAQERGDRGDLGDSEAGAGSEGQT